MVLGPRVPMSRPLSGETAIIASPPGALHNPMATIDWPNPCPVSTGSWRIWGMISSCA